MRVLLTGATGFLGSHLLKALHRSGHDIVVLKRSTSDTARIASFLPSCRAYDVDKTDVESIFQQEHIDVVIHCATVYGRAGTPAQAVVEGNILFPGRLLEGAIASGCKYFINTDSFFCKQLPKRLENGEALYLPEYTLSKAQFRDWGRLRANQGKITFINLQMEHIYGPDDGKGKFIPWVESQLAQNVPHIDLTDGIQLRDFVPVEDVAEIYLQVLDDLQGYTGYQSFEVGTGKAMPVRQFVERLKEQSGADTELRFGVIPRGEAEIMWSNAMVTSPYLTSKLKRTQGEDPE